jgi:hypothetical protein
MKSKIIIDRKIISVIFIALVVICCYLLIKMRIKDSELNTNNEVILCIPDDQILNQKNESVYSKEFIYESHGDGTCSLIGITNKNIVELQVPERSPCGDIVIKISASALKECAMLTSITISSGIKEIDSDAFIDCESLVIIMTSSANKSFCSSGGVLMSKDKSELLCYPANKIGSHYILSTDIKKISKYAFYNIKNLQKLLYEGSAKEFAEIQIDIGNQIFQKLPVTCNYISEKS